MRCRDFCTMLIIILLIIFFSCGYLLLKNYFEAKKNDIAIERLKKEITKIDDETQDASINWENLKSNNEDIIGWIEIENTKISYPILQDDDTLFYLKHNYKKEDSSSGSIFTIDRAPFRDKETTIYGHNMSNGSMFSNLDKYLDRNFLYSHLNIKIYTKTQNFNGRIFSVYSTGVVDETNNIKNLSFNQRIQYYKKASKYTIDNETEKISKIIKLSTCSYINAKSRNTDQRYYIIGSIVPAD